MAADYWDLGPAVPDYLPRIGGARPFYDHGTSCVSASSMAFQPVVVVERDVVPPPPPKPEGPKLILPDDVREAREREVAEQRIALLLDRERMWHGPQRRYLTDDECTDRYGETTTQMAETIEYLRDRLAGLPRWRRRKVRRETEVMLAHATERREEALRTRVPTDA